jgi:hypothetical protein
VFGPEQTVFVARYSPPPANQDPRHLAEELALEHARREALLERLQHRVDQRGVELEQGDLLRRLHPPRLLRHRRRVHEAHAEVGERERRRGPETVDREGRARGIDAELA